MTQKSKVPKEIVIKENKIDEKKNDLTDNFIKDGEEIRKSLSKKNLKTIRSISEKLSVNDNKFTNMESAITDQERLVERAEKNDKLEDQNINNMHETLLKNNNSRSKCTSVITGVGGITTTIAGVTIAASIGNVAAAVLGSIVVLCGTCMVAYNFYYNYSHKKPSPTIKNVDVEQGVPEASKCLPI